MTEILLLTQPACQLCNQAKDVLNRLASNFDLEVRELSFNSEAGKAFAERHRLLFAPGLLLDGEPFSYGRLSERKLRRELVRRAAASR